MDIFWSPIIVLTTQLIVVLGSGILFHVPSHIRIHIFSSVYDKSDSFGFSLAYQDQVNGDRMLLVGAPRRGKVGKVFVCSVNGIMKNEPSCTSKDIDLDILTSNTEHNYLHTNQTFFLGASIAAASDYFISCAPLWSTTIFGRKDAIGKCFIYFNDGDVRSVNLDKYYNKKNNSTTDSIGWYAYYDKTNKATLLGKRLNIISLEVPDKESDVKIRSVKRPSRDVQTRGQPKTSGRFRTDSKDVFYAHCTQKSYFDGNVMFVQKDETNAAKLKIIEDMSISGPKTALYGQAVLSSDVNQDGVDDVIVGAPAYSRDQNYEIGAVYIHLGDKDIGNIATQFTIQGSLDGSRFGAALAKSDIDGDGLPELFVSAPYEQFGGGTGALYVIPGSEILSIIQNTQHTVNLNDLKVQKIQVQGLNGFGYSLEVVKDADSNGCDELVVGAPASNTVVLLRCLPRVNVTNLSLTYHNATSDNEDIVEVCIHVSYPNKPEHITTKLKVVCEITGDGAKISGTNVIEADLSSKLPQYCDKITIKYLYKESMSHKFNAKVDVEEHEKEFSQTVFNDGWVTLGQHSKTYSSLDIMKSCEGTICEAEMKGYFFWKNNTEAVSSVDYKIGESENETVTLKVVSEGIPSFGCVQLKMNAPASVPCARNADGYLCNLKRVERGKHQNIKFIVKMTEFNNKDVQVKITATWYPVCHNKNVFDSTELNINLKVFPEVYIINSSSHFLNITEKEITSKESLNDTNIIKDSHEYVIVNNNLMAWMDVRVDVKINPAFIVSNPVITIQNSVYSKNVTNETTLTLKAHSTTKLIITIDLLKYKIQEYLKNKKATILSSVSLQLSPTDVVSANQSTTIVLQKEPYVRNNKLMIILLAIFGALIIMSLIIYIFYKYEFFERTTKKELDSLKQSIRTNSSQNSQNQDNSSGEEEKEIGEINLSVEDFEVGMNDGDVDTNVLIKTDVEVNNEDEYKKETNINNEDEYKETNINNNDAGTSTKSVSKDRLI